MVKSINEVGHVMGKKTIAEFVENEQIFNLLNDLGVDYAQGYGIGKPVPLDELKLYNPFYRDVKMKVKTTLVVNCLALMLYYS